jgi:diguanylate cyclase (GGDEF)-like protein
MPSKMWFNVAKGAASISAASLVIAALPSIAGAGPATWSVIVTALLVNTLVDLLCVAGVMMAVQGLKAGQDVLRGAGPPLLICLVNTVIGLLFLIALVFNRWSAILLAVLAASLIMVLRSFADFFRQHRTLADVYELTKAVRDQRTEASLPDVLLGRVRAVMRSEYATLWLAPQGRHPEVMLTARVENRGLLDLSPTPPAVRERAMHDGATVAVGSRFDGPDLLRSALRGSKVKDVIVVPLRSGQTQIGSLEVCNRLGDTRTFRDSDVQVLETIAAHVSVAVENARLVDRLRYDAYHDRLTALPNRRRIIDALAESVKVRAADEVVAVLLFDVDGQRDVNESMGHAAGDKLLAEVAERLRSIADPGALVGRIGGDEFVVTMRVESTDATVRLATEMREQLRGPMAVGSLTLDVDAAIGVAVYPHHGDDPET